MKLELILKMLLIDNTLELKAAKRQITKKEPCFRYVCKLASSPLIFRPRKTYIYVFERNICFFDL